MSKERSREMRKTDKKVRGMAMVVEMLALDKDLRTRFLDDAGGTLQELGVTVRDRRLLDQIVDRIKHLIEEEILVSDGIDPIGPAAVVNPSAIPTVDSVETLEGVWDEIELDFGRIQMIEKQLGSKR